MRASGASEKLLIPSWGGVKMDFSVVSGRAIRGLFQGNLLRESVQLFS